jgi:UDP-N-acetylmuramoyl-tripeptide--D-alanyl-D-alanine ligase
LAKIARPDVAVITNVGKTHRENFDDDDGIFRAKMEIAEFFDKDSLLVVNGDDEALMKLAKGGGKSYEIVTAGADSRCDYRVVNAKNIEGDAISFEVKHNHEKIMFTISVAGLYNGTYAAMAGAVLSRKGISLTQVSDALSNLSRTKHRLEVIHEGNITLIDDSYNASPESMRAGIDTLLSVKGSRKIAVLAGMNELGEESEKLHLEVGEYIVHSGVNILITVGEKARSIHEGSMATIASEIPTLDIAASKVNRLTLKHFNEKEDAVNWLLANMSEGDVFLIKGSHSYKMEEIVSQLVGESVSRPAGGVFV